MGDPRERSLPAEQSELRSAGAADVGTSGDTDVDTDKVQKVNSGMGRKGSHGSQGSSGGVEKMDIEPPVRRPSQCVEHGFEDPEILTKRVEDMTAKPEEYSVFKYYKTTGIVQKIAKHDIFENTTLAVICWNAVYIAIDTDWNKEEPLTPMPGYEPNEANWFFQTMEQLFCIYFTGEIVIRFLAFDKKYNCVKDAWFVFDSILVTLMVTETWLIPIWQGINNTEGENPLGNTAMLRLLRLLRLSRLVRMLRSLPELMILIKGMVKAAATVVYVLGLLLITTFVFSIAFTILAYGSGDLEETYFDNVLLSMYSLLIYGTYLDNLASIFDDTRLAEDGDFAWQLLPLLAVFVSINALTVMNMLIGVLCDVVTDTAKTEKEEKDRDLVQTKMADVARRLDNDFNEKISYQEFSQIIENKEALEIMVEIGVDPCKCAEFAELFFIEDGKLCELPFDKFMNMVLQLRDENEATKKDTIKLWLNIKQNINSRIDMVRSQLKEAEDRLNIWTQQIESQLALVLTELRAISQGSTHEWDK
jgi:hypothetical protein